VIACVYNRFRVEKKATAEMIVESFEMNLAKYVLEKSVVRYILYMVGLGLMTAMICWLKPFIADAEN
jgi:hypothetical protein